MSQKPNVRPSLSRLPKNRTQWASAAQGEARRAAWVIGGFLAAVLVAFVAVFSWFGSRPSREARLRDAVRTSLAERVTQDSQTRAAAQAARQAQRKAVPVHQAPAKSPNERLARLRAYYIKKKAEEEAKGIQRPPTFGERIAARDPTLLRGPPPPPFPFKYIHNSDGTVTMVRTDSEESRKAQ